MTSNEEQRDVMIHCHLIDAACQLSQTCLIHNKKPQEAAAAFSEVFGLLQDWHTGDSLKGEIAKALDVLYPDEYTPPRMPEDRA